MTNRITILAVSLIITITSLNSQTWKQIGSNINGEGENDHFGCSVSISSNGQVVASGAFWNNGNGNDSGHIRVFENSGDNWIQVGDDIDGEAEGDHLGTSIDLSADGSIVAGGAYFNDGNGNESGHVRVFQNQSGSWVQIGEDIDGENLGDYSGRCVSLNSDGTIVAIGAIWNDGNGNKSGHVRIYQNQSGSWMQIGDDIDGEAADDWSGGAISLSSDGTVVAIGASRNDGNGIDAGHVRIYKYQSETWSQIGNDLDGENAGDGFGRSVCLNNDGSIVAIGAPSNDENGSKSGHVRIFQNQNGLWTQIGDDIDGEGGFDYFGWSVNLNSDGTIVAIGAVEYIGGEQFPGYVSIFQNQSGTWKKIGDNIEGENSGDFCGMSVSLNSEGTIVSIGAYENDGNGIDAGNVRVFELEANGISELLKYGVSIFPNPTHGELIIQLKKNDIQKIVISDATGKQLFEITELTLNEIIDLSNFNTGIYIINLYFDNGMITSKIMKK